MYFSSFCRVDTLSCASVRSQATELKFWLATSEEDSCGRVLMIFCTSLSLNPGRAVSTAIGAVLTLTRAGISGSATTVAAEHNFGSWSASWLASLSGLLYTVVMVFFLLFGSGLSMLIVAPTRSKSELNEFDLPGALVRSSWKLERSPITVVFELPPF